MATEQEFPKQNLFSKMAQIMAELKRMKKGGKVDGYNGYAFATKDDVYDLLRTQMGEKNIAIFASVVDVHQDDVVSSKGSKGLHTILKMEFTLACGDTGQTFTTHWVGESTDYGDKGVSQAASLGEKYFLLSTFLLSTGDDAEQQGSVSGERQQRKQGNPQPATTGNGSQGKPSNVTDLPQQTQSNASGSDEPPSVDEKAWKKRVMDLTAFLYNDKDLNYNEFEHTASIQKRMKDDSPMGINPATQSPESAATTILAYRATKDLKIPTSEFPQAFNGKSLGALLKTYDDVAAGLDDAWIMLVDHAYRRDNKAANS